MVTKEPERRLGQRQEEEEVEDAEDDRDGGHIPPVGESSQTVDCEYAQPCHQSVQRQGGSSVLQ